MSRLLLIRHGQASLHADDYDQLSDLGQQQSAALGSYLAEAGELEQRIFVGPLRRHAQTLEHALQAGQAQPEIDVLQAFDEHQAIAMLNRELQRSADAPTKTDSKAWFGHFVKVMRGWISGSVSHPDLETWQEARRRVEQGLYEVIERMDGKDGLVFTSGGAACMAVGHALGLDDLKVYELSLALRNAAWVELAVSRSGLHLTSFNAHPHLRSDMVTSV